MLLLGMKAAEGAAILCVQRGFGSELPLTSVPVVLAAVMVAGMIPVAPANMGTYEAGVFLVYQQFGLSPDAALSLALVQHLCLLTALVGTGYVVVLVGPSREPRASRHASRPARLLHALAIWFCLLVFGLAVGLLALLRSVRRGDVGNRGTGIRVAEQERADHVPRSHEALARTGTAVGLIVGLLVTPAVGMAQAATPLAQHGHTGVPSTPEEPPPLRVYHDAAAREMIAELGPLTLPAGMNPIVTRDPNSIFGSLPASGWLRGYRVEVTAAHGRQVPSVVLHHINLMLPGRRELFSPIMQRIGSAGAETSPVTLPWFLGVPASEGDTLLVSTMLWNPTGDTYDRVYVRVHMPFTPAGTWFRPLRVFPFHMDVVPPTGARSYDLPPGRSERSWEARPAVSGRILGAGGHLHRYGIALRLEDVTAGKLLWPTTPVLDEHGDVAAMPIKRFIWPPVGLRVSADHTYRLTAVYENPTGDTIADGAMGEIGGIMLPAGRESWPAVDRRGAAYWEDRLMVIEGLTAQSAMGGGPNSHETSTRTEPEPASHSASPRPQRR